MSKRFVLVCLALFAPAPVIGLAVSPALGHEQKVVMGHQIIVGWAEEPAYTGFKNAVEITVTQPGTNAPITDIAPGEMKVEVSLGSSTSELMELNPAGPAEPGHYQADLIPSRPGEYVFHFVGTIKGQPIDERFTCGERTFDCPRTPADVFFPSKDPSGNELASRIERIDARIKNTRDDAGIGMKVGIAGIVVGAIAMGVAISARSKSKA